MFRYEGAKKLFAIGLFLIVGPLIHMALLSAGVLPTASPADATSDAGRGYIEGSAKGRTFGTWLSMCIGVGLVLRSLLPEDMRSVNVNAGKWVVAGIALLVFGWIAFEMYRGLSGQVVPR